MLSMGSRSCRPGFVVSLFERRGERGRYLRPSYSCQVVNHSLYIQYWIDSKSSNVDLQLELWAARDSSKAKFQYGISTWPGERKTYHRELHLNPLLVFVYGMVHITPALLINPRIFSTSLHSRTFFIAR